MRKLAVVSMAGALALGLSVIGLARAHAQSAALDFKIYCSRCHGENGKGDGPDAGTLKTQPRNFTDCAVMSKISDATMFKAIKDGGAAVNLPNDMPAWSAGLDDDQIHGLMAYIRKFCKK